MTTGDDRATGARARAAAETDPPLALRIRAALDGRVGVVVAAALVLALAGGYAAYTAYESPGTTVEQRQVSSWSANGSYTTGARVTEPNPLFPVGIDLADRPAYFRSISPTLQGRFAFVYRASDGGSADVTVEQTLVLRAVDEGEGGGTTEYWRVEETLGSTSASGVGPGEPVAAPFERNVNRSAARLDNLTARLGGTPGTTQILVVSTVTIDGEINGQGVTRTARYRLPIEVGGSTYRPGAVAGAELSGATSERVVRPRTYGPLYRLGGPAAAAVGLVVVAGLAYGRYRGLVTPTDAERTALALRSTRAEFDDWITVARPADAALDRPRVEVDSLEGLVDVAIDVETRVLERPDGTAYYAVADGLLYVYTPPAGVGAALAGREGAETAADAGSGSDDPPPAATDADAESEGEGETDGG